MGTPGPPPAPACAVGCLGTQHGPKTQEGLAGFGSAWFWGCYNQADCPCSPLRPSRRHFPRVMPLSKPGREPSLLLLCPPMVPMMGGCPLPQRHHKMYYLIYFLWAMALESPRHPFPQYSPDGKPHLTSCRAAGGRFLAQMPPSPNVPQGGMAADTQLWGFGCTVRTAAQGEQPPCGGS